MNQTYDLRGRLAFVEDQMRIAVAAFVEGDQAGLVQSLENAKGVLDPLLLELKGGRN